MIETRVIWLHELTPKRYQLGLPARSSLTPVSVARESERSFSDGGVCDAIVASGERERGREKGASVESLRCWEFLSLRSGWAPRGYGMSVSPARQL